MNLYGQLQKFAQQGVHSIQLDRLLQDNFDYNHLLNILPETFFTEMSHTKPEWNLKGSVCVDFGHQGVIYGYAHPQDVRFHKQRNKLPVKIGMTDEEEPVRKRIWSSTSSEYPQLLFLVTVPKASFVEKAVHQLFSRYKRYYALGQEWFDVSPSEVIEKVLWMSALSCMNSLTKGELIELSGDLHEPILNLNERIRRLQEVRNCLLKIDQNFQFQGTNFKIGEIEGRALKPNRLSTPLSSGQYLIKHRCSDYCGVTDFSQNSFQP